MNNRLYFLVFFLLIGSFVIPFSAHASIPFFGPIIPADFNVCPLSWGAVITIINNVIELLITLALVLLAPIMIAYAGFLYVVNPMDPAGISKAKSILLNTIIGIIVALAGWLIVAAVMSVLYRPDSSTGWTTTWSQLITSGGIDPCLKQESSLKTPGQTGVATPGITSVPPTTNCSASYTSNLPGINVSSSGNCCDRNNSKCTSLDGMLFSTIRQITNVKNKCGTITVTGGTEVGHSGEGSVGSHSGGSKVDIGQNIISCISGTSGSAIVSSPSFGQSQVKDKCGNIYTWEGNHTDVYIVSTCSL